MSELGSAKASMNWRVRENLESRDIFDPSSLDEEEIAMPLAQMTVADALSLDDGRVTMIGGLGGPWAQWEVIL